MKKLFKLFSILVVGLALVSCQQPNSDLPNSPEPMKTVETPEFSVASGLVISGTSVKITCATEDAKIYYTTDGSEPTPESTEYTDAIVITADMTIKAIAVKNGMNNSEVASVSYTVYNGPTYEVKFEVVETEYWWTDKYCNGTIYKIEKSEVADFAIEYMESHKPSFETKTLNENEEYVLENYSGWMFGNEEEPDSRIEVQYFANEDLTSPIEPGSVIKNENKIIYVKFVYYLYKHSYRKW